MIERKTTDERTLVNWLILISTTSGTTIKLLNVVVVVVVLMWTSAQITFMLLVKLTFYQDFHKTEVMSVTKSDRFYEIQINNFILAFT